MASFWVVAGNGTRARIFAGDGPGAELHEVECLVNSEAGQHERDLASDRPGRMRDEGGLHRSAVGETHFKEQSLDEFARRIADYLQPLREGGDIERLAIVASPSLLGRLRDSFSESVKAAVIEEVAKDVTTESAAEIQDRLTRLH